MSYIKIYKVYLYKVKKQGNNNTCVLKRCGKAIYTRLQNNDYL